MFGWIDEEDFTIRSFRNHGERMAEQGFVNQERIRFTHALGQTRFASSRFRILGEDQDLPMVFGGGFHGRESKKSARRSAGPCGIRIRKKRNNKKAERDLYSLRSYADSGAMPNQRAGRYAGLLKFES